VQESFETARIWPHNGIAREANQGGMSLRPNWRPDPERKSFGDEPRFEPASSTSGTDAAQEIATVARALADAGGGALSLDLALDLLLNETVEQARHATRATGAAIALARDGEMICRASTGNAPELGTAVDTVSGLSAACLSTGAMQQCSDTETDARVDRDVCRHLHLRSMLLIPIIEDGSVCGILEVFSSEPNNFGPNDHHTLQSLADNIVNAKKAAALGVAEDPLPTDVKPGPYHANSGVPEQSNTLDSAVESQQPPPTAVAPDTGDKNEVLSSALVVLVIAAAVLLGVVVGVRQMAKRSEEKATAAAARNVDQTPSPASPVSSINPPKSDQSSQAASPKRAAVQAPVGGLIVTQNGKVIYRAEPSPSATPSSLTAPASNRLLHRVDPKYPELAKSQHIQGAVELEAQVLGDGTVGNVAVLRGHPLLAEAAATAIKQWKYQPYSVNGRQVERQERITVKFSLPSS
jgi:TonB family protein